MSNFKFNTDYAPGPWRTFTTQKGSIKVRATDHGKQFTVAHVEQGKFTYKAMVAHGKLLALAPELAGTLAEFVQDSECYCLNPEESRGRNPCPYCKAKALLESL